MNIICYRCGGGENPENTMIGIEHCQRVQPDWPIEMDLQMSKDGQIVLFHDANTKRITGVDRQIGELALNEIQQLNAGFHFQRSREFVYRDAPLAIPSLNEVVSAYPNVQCILDVHTFDLNAVPKIIDIVVNHRLGQNVVIVSGSDAIISAFKQLKPTWRYAAATAEAKRLILRLFR